MKDHNVNVTNSQSKQRVACMYRISLWSCRGHMAGALTFRLSGLGLSLGQRHCVVFLGKTLYSQCLPLRMCLDGF